VRSCGADADACDATLSGRPAGAGRRPWQFRGHRSHADADLFRGEDATGVIPPTALVDPTIDNVATHCAVDIRKPADGRRGASFGGAQRSSSKDELVTETQDQGLVRARCRSACGCRFIARHGGEDGAHRRSGGRAKAARQLLVCVGTRCVIGRICVTPFPCWPSASLVIKRTYGSQMNEGARAACTLVAGATPTPTRLTATKAHAAVAG
jgi:hypothetical protein